MLDLEIREDDLTGPEIVRFLRDHLDYMYAVTPARALYRPYGLEYRGPFADDREDPNSLFMEKRLQEEAVRDRGTRPSYDRS